MTCKHTQQANNTTWWFLLSYPQWSVSYHIGVSRHAPHWGKNVNALSYLQGTSWWPHLHLMATAALLCLRSCVTTRAQGTKIGQSNITPIGVRWGKLWDYGFAVAQFCLQHKPSFVVFVPISWCWWWQGWYVSVQYFGLKGRQELVDWTMNHIVLLAGGFIQCSKIFSCSTYTCVAPFWFQWWCIYCTFNGYQNYGQGIDSLRWPFWMCLLWFCAMSSDWYENICNGKIAVESVNIWNTLLMAKLSVGMALLRTPKCST